MVIQQKRGYDAEWGECILTGWPQANLCRRNAVFAVPLESGATQINHLFSRDWSDRLEAPLGLKLGLQRGQQDWLPICFLQSQTDKTTWGVH
jgi:hypothetical protein